MRSTLLRLAMAIGVSVLPVAAFAQRTFTLICHVPPGNPSNGHTLSLPDAAVKAHLAHGDVFGRCESGRAGGGQPGHREPRDHPRPETPSVGDNGNTGRRSLWDNPPQSGGAARTGENPQSHKAQPETSPAGKGGGGRQPLDTFRAGNQGGNGGSQTSTGASQENGGRPSGKGPHLDNGGGNGGRGSDRNNNNHRPQMGGQPNQPQPSHNNPQMDNGGGNGGRGSGNNQPQTSAGGGRPSQPQPSNNNPQMDNGGGNGGRGSDRSNSPGGNGGGGAGQPPKKKGD